MSRRREADEEGAKDGCSRKGNKARHRLGSAQRSGKVLGKVLWMRLAGSESLSQPGGCARYLSPKAYLF